MSKIISFNSYYMDIQTYTHWTHCSTWTAKVAGKQTIQFRY